MSNQLEPQSPEERKWGMTIHLSALIGLLLPLGLVLGPLLVWMLKKNDGSFYDREGKKAVNFQLTMLVAAFVVVLLGMLIRPLMAIAFMIGLAGIVFAAISGFSLFKGNASKYPFSINFIK